MTAGPQRISDREIKLDITGYVTPFAGDQPWWLGIPGAEDVFVAVFSSPEKLWALNDAYGLGLEKARLKRIEDGREFLLSVIGHARVAADPYKHPNGKMRFSEVIGFPMEPGAGS